MKRPPITPVVHGIIDYAFSAMQLILPSLLKLNNQAKIQYLVTGASFGIVNAITDTPVAVKPVITFKDHQKADAMFLTGTALMTMSGMIRKDRRSMYFHLGFLSVAIMHYMLTDYDA